MPIKDPQKRKAYTAEYGKSWYQRNKEKVKAGVAKTKRANRQKFLEFKSTLSCSHCGFSHPAVIDFHHVVRDGTKQDINRLISASRYKAAYEEIKKCIPLCANCHRILHWNESQVSKTVRNKQHELASVTEQV